MVCDERISRGIEFQIAGAEQWKEREPKLLLDGVSEEELTKLASVKFIKDRSHVIVQQAGAGTSLMPFGNWQRRTMLH